MKAIPKHLNTDTKLETFLLLEGIKAHGGDPGPSDGDRGPKTKRGLLQVWKKHMGSSRSVHESAGKIPAYFKLAVTYDGLAEVPGSRSNKTILGWIREYFSWAKDDGELAWCAIFVNVMLKRCGLKGTGKANARSFLNWGVSKKRSPRKGDVVVFWRGSPSSWKGHVAFYASGYGTGRIKVFGGNQRDKACFSSYPESRVLDYRRGSSS